MACKKFEEFDKENPNYQFLADAIKDGKIRLVEGECLALIIAQPLDLKFGWGMKAYLESQGYSAYISWVPES